MEIPFFTKKLQTFTQRDDGRNELTESGLCLVSGAVSDTTFSRDHRWRALFLDLCVEALNELSVWKPFRTIR